MICPFCNEKTFPKKKNIMEGWSVAKTVLICPLCGKELPETPAEKESPAPDKNADRRNALSALLGGETLSSVKLAGSADRDFCRNCKNFIIHPFKNICSLTDKEADPMGSCPDFTEK